MHKILLATVAFAGLTAATTLGAAAAPSATVVHVAPSPGLVTHVDYWDHHHRWHHRHWEHHHWRYYD